MEDRLKKLFDEQLALNIHINPKFKDIINSENPEIKREWIQNVVAALMSEVVELMDTGKHYKWWGNKPDWNDDLVHNMKIELIDCVFFIVMGMQILGMDSDEMWELYLAKSKLNHKRQEKGYKTGEYQKIDSNGKEDNYYLKDIVSKK